MKIQDSLREAQENADRNLLNFDHAVQTYANLWQQLEALGDQVSVDFELQSGWINLRASGGTLLLRQVWRALRASGLNTEHRPKDAQKQTYFSTIWRNQKINEYGERRPDWDGTKLCFVFSSTVCKRVLIGTKKVEVEENVYEIQCG
jgi:hypothetical protein